MSIRVLIVDDSAIMQQTLARELKRDPEIEVVGTAPDPFVARDKILELKPDVLTLDIEMPRMDGLMFLKKLMHYYPIPVIVVSSLAKEGSPTAVNAMAVGAIDVLGKPSSLLSSHEMGMQLIYKIKAAAAAKLKHLDAGELPALKAPLKITKPITRIVAIGASTGGTQALEKILRAYPEDCPPTVIVQHMPAGFTLSFAERLNQLCANKIKEAENGDSLEAGKVLVAPGNLHTLVRRGPNGFYVEVKDGPLVGLHRPAVDVLFNSVAACAKDKAVGVLLTGMGQDGAQGLKKMRDVGAMTIAQDEATSVVFGMPRAAIEQGAACEVLPLPDIAAKVISAACS